MAPIPSQQMLVTKNYSRPSIMLLLNFQELGQELWGVPTLSAAEDMDGASVASRVHNTTPA